MSYFYKLSFLFVCNPSFLFLRSYVTYWLENDNASTETRMLKPAAEIRRKFGLKLDARVMYPRDNRRLFRWQEWIIILNI